MSHAHVFEIDGEMLRELLGEGSEGSLDLSKLRSMLGDDGPEGLGRLASMFGHRGSRRNQFMPVGIPVFQHGPEVRKFALGDRLDGEFPATIEILTMESPLRQDQGSLAIRFLITVPAVFTEGDEDEANDDATTTGSVLMVMEGADLFHVWRTVQLLLRTEVIGKKTTEHAHMLTNRSTADRIADEWDEYPLARNTVGGRAVVDEVMAAPVPQELVNEALLLLTDDGSTKAYHFTTELRAGTLEDDGFLSLYDVLSVEAADEIAQRREETLAPYLPIVTRYIETAGYQQGLERLVGQESSATLRKLTEHGILHYLVKVLERMPDVGMDEAISIALAYGKLEAYRASGIPGQLAVDVAAIIVARWVSAYFDDNELENSGERALTNFLAATTLDVSQMPVADENRLQYEPW